MVIGENAKTDDLEVNPMKAKRARQLPARAAARMMRSA
ncbi:hypothetical protein AB5I41_02765 [Sphingomonas sp. MMS24-JH45]